MTGKTSDAAMATLEDKNLTVSREFEFSNDVPAGQVIRQDPKSGSTVKEGTKVTIYVSQGSESVKVPDVRGKSEADAKAALSEFAVTTTTEHSDSVASGNVISQSIDAGQRRYMESLSSYARQFLGQMEKPNVEKIEGLSPAISIDQKSTNRNPRSTVGTVTEIYDYFRLLYARIGIPHCPKCGKEIKKQTVDQMADQIMQLPERTKIQLLAPVVRGRKGTHQKLLDSIKRSGYVRVQQEM